MCHLAFLSGQKRLVAAGGYRHLNLMITTTLRQNTKQAYRKVNTHVKRVAGTAAEASPEPPTARQLATYAVKCAIPMIGFGFMVSLYAECFYVVLCSFQHSTNILFDCRTIQS